MEQRIAAGIKQRREALSLTVNDLALRSGVSRAMISKIERVEASPTAALLGRLCNALGITLSSLIASAENAPSLPLMRAKNQLTWRDPETGLRRTMVSPVNTGSRVEIVQLELPANTAVAYERQQVTQYEQHILVLEGTLSLSTEGQDIAARTGRLFVSSSRSRTPFREQCAARVPLFGCDLQMIMSSVHIRDAAERDLEDMRQIYNDVLVSTTSIFSDIERTSPEQTKWFDERCAQGWPVLVICEHEQVLGYASYGPFRSWPGYRHTVENSIYLTQRARGRGLGTQLLRALVARAESQGLHAVIAGIDGDNVGSMRLHEKLGFTKVAHLKEVGCKWNRWLDLVLFEKLLI